VTPALLLRRATVVMVAMLAGVLLSELAISAARGFAFPYLNIFEADERLGVRLQKDASTRTRSRTGRVTNVRTNADGFRGPAWREADEVVPGRVLLLGDSQVFGYGVEEADAMAARLHAITGGEVLCAAVPTWGPSEYARAARELVPRFRPEHVIFVGNLANDWLEARAPNTRRSTARDGWVTRVRAGVEPPVAFPGRQALLSRSQLVFLARELGVVLRERGLPQNAAAEHLARNAPRLRAHGEYKTPLAPFIADVRDTCAAHGCRAHVAALPLDVLVADDEWQKYGTPARDLSAARALLSDLLTDSVRLGVPALTLFPVLRAASPGAFLQDDYHLSPRGHDAVARALASALRAEEGA
jgi:hypothetical protein